MATYLIAGGTCVVAVALVPTVARIRGHTNLQEVLPKLKIPVLTMYPVHDAGFYPFSNVEENAKLMTSAKANVVKLETNAKGTTCGHIVPWELPKKYCELVAENIKKAK